MRWNAAHEEGAGDDGDPDDVGNVRHGRHGRDADAIETTPEQLRSWLDERRALYVNPRLSVGEIARGGDGLITAEIVTVDGSLVQGLAFNRWPGFVRRID